jgi:hypothetical protein
VTVEVIQQIELVEIAAVSSMVYSKAHSIYSIHTIVQ